MNFCKGRGQGVCRRCRGVDGESVGGGGGWHGQERAGWPGNLGAIGHGVGGGWWVGGGWVVGGGWRMVGCGLCVVRCGLCVVSVRGGWVVDGGWWVEGSGLFVVRCGLYVVSACGGLVGRWPCQEHTLRGATPGAPRSEQCNQLASRAGMRTTHHELEVQLHAKAVPGTNTWVER
jgi:hypothetical protein